MSVTKSWKDLPPKVLLETTDFCDAYSIVGVEAFVELGVPAELVAPYESTHVGKRFTDAEDDAVTEIRGVNCLTILHAINHDLGLPGSCFLGRQRQVHQMKAQIAAFLMRTMS